MVRKTVSDQLSGIPVSGYTKTEKNVFSTLFLPNQLPFLRLRLEIYMSHKPFSSYYFAHIHPMIQYTFTCPG